MSRTFEIDKDYYEEGEIIYKRKTMTFEPGLTVLVGCNGSGKTTLLKHMKYQLEGELIPCVMFDNLRDGGQNARSLAAYCEDYQFFAMSRASSEGENIMMNLSRIAGKIGEMLRENPDANELWILMDAVDSGLSLDNIRDIKKDLVNFVLEMEEKKDVYFIMSANEYELAHGEKCFCVTDGKYVNIGSYDRYRSVILRTRNFKDKRYGGDKE